jgi:hypothetical protein
MLPTADPNPFSSHNWLFGEQKLDSVESKELVSKKSKKKEKKAVKATPV